LEADVTNNIVRDMPAENYHATAALSASGAFTLASECAALYHYSSPFNPDAVQEEANGRMDVGTALHLAALEPHRLLDHTRIVDADDWRTKDARAERDDAREAGIVPLLRKDLDLVTRLHGALRANPYVVDLLDGADTEVSYFWTADGVPLKARADIIARDGMAIGDLKASANASPGFFQRQAFNAGHFLRAAWYQAGWREAAGKKADYWFVVVSREPPHLVTIARLDDRALAWGEMMMRRALDLFRKCREAGIWPPYCTEPATLGLPPWAEYQLADREQAGDFSPADVRRSLEWMEP
jgi:hypothetical protein